MKELYVFGFIIVVPFLLKYLLSSFYIDKSVSKGISICLYGNFNTFTVPILMEINKLKIPTMIAVDSLNSIPIPLLDYVERSTNYKFIPYIKQGTSNFLAETVGSLSNTSIVIHHTALTYGNKIVLRPYYFLPSTQYTGMELMHRVWNDFKQHKIQGLVMIPYTNATYHYVNEFIHDIIRWKHTINTDWYSM